MLPFILQEFFGTNNEAQLKEDLKNYFIYFLLSRPLKLVAYLIFLRVHYKEFRKKKLVLSRKKLTVLINYLSCL